MSKKVFARTAIALAVFGTACVFSANNAQAIQLAVPSYYNPGDAGFTTIENVGGKCGIAMINPGNGEINPNDGSTYDSEPLGPWVTQAQQIKNAGS